MGLKVTIMPIWSFLSILDWLLICSIHCLCVLFIFIDFYVLVY